MPGQRLERLAGRRRRRGASSPSRSSAPVSIGRGQRPSVARLLAAEPDRQQLGVGQLEEARRRQRIGHGPQPIEGGPRRGERDLLLEDDVEERPEARARGPTAAAGRSARRSRPGPHRDARAPRPRTPGWPSSAPSRRPSTRRAIRDRAAFAEAARRQRIERAALRAAQPGPGVLAERRPVVAALLEDDEPPPERAVRRPISW